MAPSHKV